MWNQLTLYKGGYFNIKLKSSMPTNAFKKIKMKGSSKNTTKSTLHFLKLFHSKILVVSN
jgi:hypothetical protein